MHKDQVERGAILFDQPHGNDLWRLEIAFHNGRRFGNWRKWFWSDGELKPTRQGVIIPIDRIPEIYGALGDYLSHQGLADASRSAK